MKRRLILLSLGMALVAPAVALSRPPDGTIDFKRDVYPLLRDRCFKCHSGPNSKSGARLDFRPELLGESNGRPLAVPGKSGESRVLRLVSAAADDDTKMPPTGRRLSSAEVAVLRTWIDQGVAWDEALLPSTVTSDHWAFRKIRRPVVPDLSGWGRTPVDAFIAAEHRARGLSPAAEAPRRTLLRRLTLDLTGLPPTPDEMRAFLDDPSLAAYEKQVERLLASPTHGERWGRHWLDVARYAESEGYESNHPRPYAWRYRDYVIDAFNRDLPFDRFIREQLAGDEIEPYEDRNLVATGFLAAARLSSNEEDKALQRNDVLVDLVNATGAAFLGLTLNCAQCHSHKFDPLPQRDFYRLQAFFVKGMPVNLPLRDPALRAAFDARKPLEIESALKLKEALFEKGRQRFIENAKKRMSPAMREALDVPDAKRTAEERELFRQADLLFQSTPDGYERQIPEEDKKLYVEVKKKLDELKKRGAPDEPQAWGFYSPATSPHAIDVLPQIGFYPLPYEPAELRSAAGYLRVRGEVHRRGPAVEPGWPEVLGPTPAIGPRPRTALADWLACRDNPLVARVWANRVWHGHFGRGIVASPGDFGVKGAPPSNPKLLDWLACELLEGGWSTKRLHRLIVTSATYRQASAPDARNAAIDPDDVHLWRWSPRRLEAEAIRDSVLAASGELDAATGGPADPAETSLRRAVYLAQKRDGPGRFAAMFDGPTANESCACRHVSTVSLQPLLLLNNPFMVKRARALADRLWAESGSDPRAQVERAFEIVLARPPSEAERRAGEEYLGGASPVDGPPARLAQFCQVMLNLNEAVYLE
jgi:hypothetical protein